MICSLLIFIMCTINTCSILKSQQIWRKILIKCVSMLPPPLDYSAVVNMDSLRAFTNKLIDWDLPKNNLVCWGLEILRKKYKRDLKSLVMLRIQWLNINSGQWLRKFVSHCVAGYRRWEEKANSKAFIEKPECRCIDAVEIIFVINELWKEENTWTTTDGNAKKVFSSKFIPCLQQLSRY